MPGARFFLRRLIYAAISLAILALTVLAFNLFGDALRDAMDPRLHR